jgi:mono/diheme cytochrome c family protein
MDHQNFLIGAVALACAAGLNGAVSGAEVYQKYCAACHDQASPRIPPKEALQKLSSARILRTLDFGLMMSIAYPLKREAAGQRVLLL